MSSPSWWDLALCTYRRGHVGVDVLFPEDTLVFLVLEATKVQVPFGVVFFNALDTVGTSKQGTAS